MHILGSDIETTGLDPEENQILECGLVLFNTKTKKKVCENWIVQHHTYTGDAFALSMNKRIFDELKEPLKSKENIIWHEHLAGVIYDFLIINDVTLPVTIAGKNFGVFDLQFLQKLNGFEKDKKWFHRRILDIGSLFFDPLRDSELPSLAECKKRAGIDGQVTHKAVDDANDVIDCIIEYYKF